MCNCFYLNVEILELKLLPLPAHQPLSNGDHQTNTNRINIKVANTVLITDQGDPFYELPSPERDKHRKMVES
jgi:hypothetical protein